MHERARRQGLIPPGCQTEPDADQVNPVLILHKLMRRRRPKQRLGFPSVSLRQPIVFHSPKVSAAGVRLPSWWEQIPQLRCRQWIRYCILMLLCVRTNAGLHAIWCRGSTAWGG